MSDREPRPEVAFWLRATTVAMKAKTGKRVASVDVTDLVRLQVQLLPANGDVARAITRFIARWVEDPSHEAAGAGLIAFLKDWPDGDLGDLAGQIERAIEHFDGGKPEGFDGWVSGAVPVSGSEVA